MEKFAFFDTKPYDKPGFEKYGPPAGIAFKYYESKLNEDTAGLAAGCTGVVAFVNDTINEPVIRALQAQGIRLIALRCAGFNNVDLKAACGKLPVVRVPAYSPYAVAEHAMAMLLTSVRRIHKAYNRTREFNFSLRGLTGFDLHGKRVGVVGTGRIGKVFIDICKGFGMDVSAYDPYPDPDAGIRYVSLNELFAGSDILSLHCPLSSQTRHLINADTIAQMKKGVVILNTSRGGLIDTEALTEAIKNKQVGAACLDVYEEESELFYEDNSGHILQDDVLARLISMPNVLLTSHQAFLTEEALQNIAEVTVRNIRTFLDGGELENEICYQELLQKQHQK